MATRPGRSLRAISPNSYDADGNLTSDGTNSYIWDARGHLTTLAGANVAAYQYDALGRRVQNTMNGVMTQYLYDGLNPVEELDGASPANVTATMLTGLGIDEYFARSDSNGTVSYLTNRLGSTIALTDSSGAITTQYTYDPFGNTTVSGSSTNPFQFTGRENDGTGLYYDRGRYYSPTLHGFISQDPSDLTGMDPTVPSYVNMYFDEGPLEFNDDATNLYAYTGDDPVDWYDPNGAGRRGGRQGKGERRYQRKNPNTEKHTRYNENKGVYEKQDPHTGQWKPKGRNWKPDNNSQCQIHIPPPPPWLPLIPFLLPIPGNPIYGGV